MIAIIIAIISFSCTKNNQKVVAEVLIKEWTGKQIQLPNSFACRWQNSDTSLCASLLNKEYKVLLYVDSTGCTSCKLGLMQWKRLISRVDTMINIKGKLSFLLFFHPKDEKELGFLLKRDNLSYPVFLDTANTINKLNHFPTDPAYQCFLLDRHNKVLAIGNRIYGFILALRRHTHHGWLKETFEYVTNSFDFVPFSRCCVSALERYIVDP